MRRRFAMDNLLLLKVRDFFSSNRLVFQANMAHRVKDISKRFEECNSLTKGWISNTSIPTTSGNTNMPEATTFMHKITGREKDISNLVDMLMKPSLKEWESNPSVIPIVGMGGIGKTQLAHSIYNDESVIKHFDFRIWISLSADFDMYKIFQDIIDYINTECEPEGYSYAGIDSMFIHVRKMLNEKKYLIVLDDLWDVDDNPINWYNLQRCVMDGSSKIVATTRKISAAQNVRGITAYHLQQLSTDDCWSIMKEKAFSHGGALESPRKVNIGKEIAMKCCGLPLAARILGRILYSKRGEWEWDLIRDAEIRDIPEFQKKIYSTIKLSYDRLRSSTLKRCFSYCSIFPRGWVIDREAIIQLWMAEGFLVPGRATSWDSRETSMEDMGDHYFDRLLSDSLFLSVENKNDMGEIQKCKLHDFVHYLARTLAGEDRCSTLTSKEVVSTYSKSTSQLRHLRLDFDEDMPRRFPIVGAYKKILRTFVAIEVGDCDEIDEVFQNKNLRVLYLSGSSILNVPASLSKLRHLRYLNLSGCQNLEVLSDQSVKNLYNLQTLVLDSCISLSKLPKGIGSLKNLRHLYLSNTRIQSLPTSVITLQNLRTLDVSNCTDFEKLPEDIGALKNLRELDISGTKVIKLPNSISGLERLVKLRLHYCPNLEALPREVYEALTSLRGLDITGVKTMEVVPEFVA